jgi:hypothetical protein
VLWLPPTAVIHSKWRTVRLRSLAYLVVLSFCLSVERRSTATRPSHRGTATRAAGIGHSGWLATVGWGCCGVAHRHTYSV